MKKVTMLITIVIAVLLTLLIGGTVFAALYESADSNNAQDQLNESPAPDFSNAKKDTSAEAKRTVTLEDGEAVNVKYTRSKDQGDSKEVDVYVDDDGKEYIFEKDGTYLGMITSPNTGTEGSVSVELTEDEICKIAKDYAVSMFGSDIEKYTMTNLYYQELYDRYFITFAKKYGKDGFATGEVCKTVIGSDGIVMSCTTPMGSELEDFDAALLNGITLADVKAFAEKQAADIFDSLKSSELSGVFIVKKTENIRFGSHITIQPRALNRI